MRVLLLVVLAQLMGVSAIADDEPGAIPALNDSWITEPPSHGEFGIEGWTVLPGSMFAFVPQSRDHKALNLLESRDSVAIDCKLVLHLVKSLKCPRRQNLKPYLVRAVELKQSLGSMGPFQKDGEIWMVYNGPIEPGTIRRRAAILYLPAPPKHLYVTITLYS